MLDSNASRSIILRDIDSSSSDYLSLLSELKGLVRQTGLSFDDSVLDLCLQHFLYVCQVNEYINLTRITDLHEGLILHILDSLMLDPFVPHDTTRLLDMGTGAGYPGLPIHLIRHADSVLLDSVGKKVRAVDSFIHKLGLDGIIAHHDRLESFALDNPQSFDCVIARALAPLPVLLEYASPFLSKNGIAVLAKGVPDNDEFQASLKAAALCGFEFLTRNDYELPESMGHRSVFIYRKVRKPSVSLPRKPGTAKRSPLA